MKVSKLFFAFLLLYSISFGRQMDSFVGRWISKDVNKGLINQPQTLNRYIYVVNNPLRYTDPDGKFLMIPVLVAFAVLGSWEYANAPGVDFKTYKGPGAAGVFSILGMGGGGATVSASETGAAKIFAAEEATKQVAKDASVQITAKTTGQLIKDVGKFFGWGPSTITKSIGDFSKDALLKAGWTRERLLNVAKGYEEVIKITPKNPSAAGRAEQLKDLSKLFDTK
jgi:hypothetical protein